MRFINVLNSPEFDNLSEYEVIDSLVEKGILYHAFSLDQLQPLKELEKITDMEPTLIPHPRLVKQFWDFIKNHYKDLYINIKNNYFLLFEEDCYGLNQEQKKKDALDDFNSIYNDLKIQLPYYIESIENMNNNFPKTIVHSKLFKVYHLISHIKQEITGFKEVEQYLRGNLSYYDDKFLKNNKQFADLLHLIFVSEILVELNQRFNFEEDIYFNNEFSMKIKYENEHVKKVFKSIEAFSFANSLIESFDKDVKANIESLYEVLRSENLIFDNKKKFMNFIQEEYLISITKIISYDFNQNLFHDKRVADFHTRWLTRS